MPAQCAALPPAPCTLPCSARPGCHIFTTPRSASSTMVGAEPHIRTQKRPSRSVPPQHPPCWLGRASWQDGRAAAATQPPPAPSAGQGHPMKPHRVRMAHSLVLHYGLYSKLDGVRQLSWQGTARLQSATVVGRLQRSPCSAARLSCLLARQADSDAFVAVLPWRFAAVGAWSWQQCWLRVPRSSGHPALTPRSVHVALTLAACAGFTAPGFLSAATRASCSTTPPPEPAPKTWQPFTPRTMWTS